MDLFTTLDQLTQNGILLYVGHYPAQTGSATRMSRPSGLNGRSKYPYTFV